jgi:hypothetical protein
MVLVTTKSYTVYTPSALPRYYVGAKTDLDSGEMGELCSEESRSRWLLINKKNRRCIHWITPVIGKTKMMTNTEIPNEMVSSKLQAAQPIPDHCRRPTTRGSWKTKGTGAECMMTVG